METQIGVLPADCLRRILDERDDVTLLSEAGQQRTALRGIAAVHELAREVDPQLIEARGCPLPLLGNLA